MIIQPKKRGFICTTAHPQGCFEQVKQQIKYIQSQPALTQIPKRVLIIGASSGYGLASRITCAFGAQAATLGVFLEKEGTAKKTASAGWYNTVAFEDFANQSGLYAKHINADAFDQSTKTKTIALIQQDWQQVDMVIYSLAAPVRKMPDGRLVRSTLKPISQPYRTAAIDLNNHNIVDAEIPAASDAEIEDTITVMGGDDWEQWLTQLNEAGVLAPGATTLAYSYIGTEITWPIYWEGTVGQAKKDLEKTALNIHQQLKPQQGSAHIAVLKSIVTQASAAIPMMPLYLSLVTKKMKQVGLHENCIEQIYRLVDSLQHPSRLPLDAQGRIRLDDRELQAEVQQHCQTWWSKITTDNLYELTDYASFQSEFMNLFGFECAGVAYDQDTETRLPLHNLHL